MVKIEFFLLLDQQIEYNRLMIYILVFSKLSNNVGYICLKMISKFEHYVHNSFL
jgi:hypothetical protein